MFIPGKNEIIKRNGISCNFFFYFKRFRFYRLLIFFFFFISKWNFYKSVNDLINIKLQWNKKRGRKYARYVALFSMPSFYLSIISLKSLKDIIFTRTNSTKLSFAEYHWATASPLSLTVVILMDKRGNNSNEFITVNTLHKKKSLFSFSINFARGKQESSILLFRKRNEWNY